jgi:hypothetical protein
MWAAEHIKWHLPAIKEVLVAQPSV